MSIILVTPDVQEPQGEPPPPHTAYVTYIRNVMKWGEHPRNLSVGGTPGGLVHERSGGRPDNPAGSSGIVPRGLAVGAVRDNYKRSDGRELDEANCRHRPVVRTFRFFGRSPIRHISSSRYLRFLIRVLLYQHMLVYDRFANSTIYNTMRNGAN